MFLQVFHEQTHWISKYHKNPYNWTRDKYHDTQHEHTPTHTHSCRKHCKHGGCATTPAKGGERRALLTHQFHSRVCVTKNQSPCGLGGTVAGAKADCHHEAGLQRLVWPGPGALILISFPVFVLLWFWKKADMEVKPKLQRARTPALARGKTLDAFYSSMTRELWLSF